MDPEQQEEFNTLKNEVRELKQLFEDVFGGSPERVGQVIVSQVVVKSPTAGRVIRITTNQGEYNVLAE